MHAHHLSTPFQHGTADMCDRLNQLSSLDAWSTLMRWIESAPPMVAPACLVCSDELGRASMSNRTLVCQYPAMDVMIVNACKI